VNDRSISGLVHSFLEGWNRRDWPAFAACFSEEADYVTGEGTRWSGRQNILRGMQGLLAAGETGGTAIISHQTVRQLDNGAAVVHLNWRLADEESANSPPSLPHEGITTLVVALREGVWLIEAAQNTDTATPPSSQPHG
jgi:uncharacterized protein (TIGR02246 family)